MKNTKEKIKKQSKVIRLSFRRVDFARPFIMILKDSKVNFQNQDGGDPGKAIRSL